ncbi:MAG: DNA polymerase III subunit gamma/tau [Patescibacteria group bacterium]
MVKTSVSKSEKTEPFVSLYRKYRPADFSEVVGQEQVVRVLEESIKQGKLAHAYLFCGSRGTGKTSIARIFAHAIGTTANDLYEIDAASNTSVEDIRQLNEAVNTIPFESAYKVYILDEVHMLSKSAFNAFLKTLEEPPKHVIFILATTEMEKLPDTIVSRCQTFVFKKPTAEMLKGVVIDVAKKEDVKLEGAAVELVALLGDGSFRDTLSILQKVLIASEGEITLNDVEKVTGAPKSTLVLTFVESLVKKDTSSALTALGTASSEHVDMKVFNKLTLARLRYLLLRLAAPSIAKEESVAGIFTANELTCLDAIVVDQGYLVKTLYAFLDASQQIGKSHIATLPLELAVVKLSSGVA